MHLARWYPYRADPMFGLFVQNHVKALVPEVHSTVIFVWPIKGAKSIEREVRTDLGFDEICITFPESTWAPANWLSFFRILWKEIWSVHRLDPVQLIHVHVLTRLAATALIFKWSTGVPYIVTEHWTRYVESSRFRGKIRKWATGFTLKHAECLTNVSTFLQMAIFNHGFRVKRAAIVGNVVDFDLFQIRAESSDPYFVHVSTFEEIHKNISGMIRTIGRLRDEGHPIKLLLVGDGTAMKMSRALVASLRLEEIVLFSGTLSGEPLCKAIAESKAYIQFSNYENMPVVISEALACGVPVISTNVGGIAEMVNDSNGILIEPADEAALADAILKLNTTRNGFNPVAIREGVRTKFSVAAVKGAFLDIYRDVLKSNTSTTTNG